MRYVPLHSICRPKQWKTIASSKLRDEGYPVYGANGIIGYHDEFNHAHPTLLITCRGATCGKLNVSKPFSYINGNAMALDDLSGEVDLNFLAYFLAHRGFDDVISGSAQPQITGQGLQKVLVPLPSLEEQKRIAGILDEADRVRKKTQALIAKYDELAQSLFLDMFGDPLSNSSSEFVDFESVMSRITYGYTRPMSHHDSGIPILTAKNIRSGYIDWTKIHFACRSEFDELSAKSKPQKDDILVTKDGSIGRTAVFDENRAVCINQSVALIRPNPELIKSTYVESYLNSQPIQLKLQRMGKGGGLKHLQITELAKLPMARPSLEYQGDFAVKKAEIIEERKKAIQQSTVAETLFKALLQKAFKGELT